MKSEIGRPIFVAAACYLICAQSAYAQMAQVVELVPDSIEVTDQNGVDLTSGYLRVNIEDASIGGERPLSNAIEIYNAPNLYATTASPNTGAVNGFYSYAKPHLPTKTNFMGGLSTSASAYAWRQVNGNWVQQNTLDFSFGGVSESFYMDNSPPDGHVYTSYSKSGGKLSFVGGAEYKYESRSGDLYFILSSIPLNLLSHANTWAVYKIIHRDGMETRMNYDGVKLISVVRSDGFQIRYAFDGSGRLKHSRVVNGSYEYCADFDQLCGVGWPTANYAWSNGGSTFTIVDALGASDIFNLDSYQRISSRKERGATNQPNVYIEYCARVVPLNCGSVFGGKNYPDKVVNLTKNGMVYNYVFTPAISMGQFSSYIRSDGYHLPQEAFRNQGVLVYIKGSDGAFTSFSSEATGHIVYQEKDGVRRTYTYDGRGNVTEKRVRPRVGSGQPDQVWTAGYALTCSNLKTCNRPLWTRDPAGAQTDYTYDSAHGGVLTVTSPADSNGVRREIRHEYIERQPWLKSATGGYTAGPPIWLLARTRTCISSATVNGVCAAGPLDEVVTEYDYGGSVGPNNLLVRGVAVTAANHSNQIETHRTCFGIDRQGRKISETAPRAALATCS